MIKLLMKKCTKCKIIKPISNFSKQSSSKDGLKYYCRLCSLKTQQTEIQKERRRAYQKEYINRPENIEHNKQYQKEYRKEYRKRPLVKVKYRILGVLEREKKTKRVPMWLTEQEKLEIEKFYYYCPEGYEVDHIIPLNGKTVSGFHVLNNLQYLIKKENRRKGNKYPYEEQDYSSVVLFGNLFGRQRREVE